MAEESAKQQPSRVAAYFREGLATLEAYWREGLKDLQLMVVNAFPHPRNVGEPGTIANITQREAYQNRYGESSFGKGVQAPELVKAETTETKIAPEHGVHGMANEQKSVHGDQGQQTDAPQQYTRSAEQQEAAQRSAAQQAAEAAKTQEPGQGMSR